MKESNRVTTRLLLAKIVYDEVLFFPCKIPVMEAKAMVTPIGNIESKKKILLLMPAAANSSCPSFATIILSKKPVSTNPI